MNAVETSDNARCPGKNYEFVRTFASPYWAEAKRDMYNTT